MPPRRHRRRHALPPFNPREIHIPDTMPWPDRRKVKDVPPEDKIDADGYCAYRFGGLESWLDNPWRHYADHPYKRVPVRCPLCRRSMVARVTFFDNERMFVVPRHKPRGYKIPPKQIRMKDRRHTKCGHIERIRKRWPGK